MICKWDEVRYLFWCQQLVVLLSGYRTSPSAPVWAKVHCDDVDQFRCVMSSKRTQYDNCYQTAIFYNGDCPTKLLRPVSSSSVLCKWGSDGVWVTRCPGLGWGCSGDRQPTESWAASVWPGRRVRHLLPSRGQWITRISYDPINYLTGWECETFENSPVWLDQETSNIARDSNSSDPLILWQ